MKHIIGQYIISTIIVLAIFIVIREINDSRPFKFEDYNYGNFNSAIQKRFPVGTNVDEVIEILVGSNINNIRIMKVDHKDKYGYMKEAVYYIYFKYYTPFLSLNFNSLYIINMEIDKNRRIINIMGST